MSIAKERKSLRYTWAQWVGGNQSLFRQGFQFHSKANRIFFFAIAHTLALSHTDTNTSTFTYPFSYVYSISLLCSFFLPSRRQTESDKKKRIVNSHIHMHTHEPKYYEMCTRISRFWKNHICRWAEGSSTNNRAAGNLMVRCRLVPWRLFNVNILGACIETTTACDASIAFLHSITHNTTENTLCLIKWN